MKKTFRSVRILRSWHAFNEALSRKDLYGMGLPIACDQRHAFCWSISTKTRCAQLYTALLYQLNNQQSSQPKRGTKL